ncbi:helix-turn-helix transcriptional regulator [Kineothrix sp. MSJ-39]|uniref:helix-turn-helix domain-containing protein n=1 Tax=Kineothrix sp. MSJ-39 TaxID=2841533 RepID=UPI001C1149AA|nr:helix-turn-helix transcriptional regulator [Kineothrix sp. MSJ-39]MBU5430607.1 helix-turn-helix transcriptional regulator [Kineothrix sp. MSJ-39]
MDKERIGLRIKLERTKQNLTQEQLAELADISSSYLSAIERGKQSISLDYTNRIAEALKIPVNELLTHEPESRYGVAEKPTGTGKVAISNAERKRKMAELEEMIGSRNDREFNLIYDEVALFISKLQYFGDRR